MGTANILLLCRIPDVLVGCRAIESDFAGIPSIAYGIALGDPAARIDISAAQIDLIVHSRSELANESGLKNLRVVWIAAVSSTEFFAYFHYENGMLRRSMLLGEVEQFEWSSVTGEIEAWETAAFGGQSIPENGSLDLQADAMLLARLACEFWTKAQRD